LLNIIAQRHGQDGLSSLPRHFGRLYQRRSIQVLAMRAETERTIAEIKQALSLLRRHL